MGHTGAPWLLAGLYTPLVFLMGCGADTNNKFMLTIHHLHLVVHWKDWRICNYEPKFLLRFCILWSTMLKLPGCSLDYIYIIYVISHRSFWYLMELRDTVCSVLCYGGGGGGVRLRAPPPQIKPFYLSKPQQYTYLWASPEFREQFNQATFSHSNPIIPTTLKHNGPPLHRPPYPFSKRGCRSGGVFGGGYIYT